MWLNFVDLPQLGLTIAIVSGMLVMFLAFLLLAISKIIENPRWRVNFATRDWLGRPALGLWNA